MLLPVSLDLALALIGLPSLDLLVILLKLSCMLPCCMFIFLYVGVACVLSTVLLTPLWIWMR